MDKISYTTECKDESAPHLPLGRLFYLLHSQGFNVKPDDYIEMLKVTERFGSADLDKTAQWLCPIIATSETEQRRFYHIIDQYKKNESLQACNDPVIRKPIPLWFKITMALVLVALLLLTIFLSTRRSTAAMEEPNKERTVEKGKAALFDATDLLRDRLHDTSLLNVDWQFDDGSVTHGLRAAHVFARPGNFIVTRNFHSGSLPMKKTADSLLVHVCDDLPVVNIQIPPEAVTVRQPVTLTASVDAEPGTVSSYQWTINDSVFTTQEPTVKNFIFTREGDFPVECKAVVGDKESPCSMTDNEIIQVLSNDFHYSARFTGTGRSRYSAKTSLQWWVSLVLLLPAVGGLLYSFLRRKKKPAPETPQPAAPVSGKGPYDIPFEQTDTKLIQPERDLRRTLIQLRYKAEEETMALNIGGTIQSIIRSGGSPQLVFMPVSRQQQYLFLIDRTNPKSMLLHLFVYLARILTEDGLPVVIFYYDKQLLCSNDQNPVGLSLQKLADMYADATLLIMGRAHELLYAVYPVIEEKYLQQLNRWQNKAIITPVPLADWGVKEKILQESMILLPADTMALQKLVPALKEKMKPNKRLLELTLPQNKSIRNIDFREISELKDYLNNDEAIFQWLCAICVYPRIRWELLIETGQVILTKYGCPEALNYTNLLMICRISWMQQGVFPQATRLELLKELTVENEVTSREKLLQLLNYSTLIYGDGGRFFEEEKRRQELTNQFILHASNNDPYNRYSASRNAFKKLWATNGILDVPVKKYLDKKEADSWQTPVSDGKRSVGLTVYFDKHEIAASGKWPRKKVLAATASFLLLLLWLYLGWGGGADKLSSLISLSRQNESELVHVDMKVIRNFDHCGDSVNTRFEQLDGYLEINNKRFALAYNPVNAIASFAVPYNLINGAARMQFSWGVNKSAHARLRDVNKRFPDTVTIGCLDAEKILKQQLYIRYNDEAGYKAIKSTLTNALFRYSVSEEPVDFSDSSRIIYYETNQKGRADSIVRIIKRTFNISVSEEYIREDRTPPAVPILFLNTSFPHVREAVPDNNGNSKSDADDYHRLGDTYFSKKQYRQAIEQYTTSISLNPREALVFYQRGICYEMLGESNNEKALADYTAALRLSPSDPSYYYRRAIVQYELRRYIAAIKDFDKVIAIHAPEGETQYISALYFRGKSKYFSNQVSGACLDFKAAADAGYAAGKKDYGLYCEVANNAANDPPPNGNAGQQKETSFGIIEYDAKGYPNTAGLQLISKVAALMKSQPAGRLRLTASYSRDPEKKSMQSFMNNVVAIFSKNGDDIKARISTIQETGHEPNQKAPQMQQRMRQLTSTPGITVTGINLQDEPLQPQY